MDRIPLKGRPHGYSEGLELLSVLGNVEEFETRAGQVQHPPLLVGC
jgi:hypothetical protein